MRAHIFFTTVLAAFTTADIPPIIASIDPLDVAAKTNKNWHWENKPGDNFGTHNTPHQPVNKLTHALSALMSSAADWNSQVDSLSNQLSRWSIWSDDRDRRDVPESMLSGLFKSQKESVYDEVTKGSKDAVKEAERAAKKLKHSLSSWLPDSSTSLFRRSKTEEAMHKAKDSKKKVMQVANGLTDDAKKHLKIALDDMETAILGDVVASLAEDVGAMKNQNHPRFWSLSLMDLFSSKSTEEKIRDEIMKQFTSRSNTMDKLKKKINALTPGADKDKLLKEFKGLEKSFEDSLKSISGSASDVYQKATKRRLQEVEVEVEVKDPKEDEEKEEKEEKEEQDEEETTECAETEAVLETAEPPKNLEGLEEAVSAETIEQEKQEAAGEISEETTPEEELTTEEGDGLEDEVIFEEPEAKDVTGVTDTIKEKAEDAKEKAGEAKDKIVEKSGDIKESIENATSDAKDKADDKAEDAKDKAEDVKDDAEDKAKDVKDKTKEKADDAKEKADDLKDGAEDEVKDAKNKTEDKAEETKDKTKDKAEDAKDKTEDKAEDVKEKVGDVKDDVEEKAKDAKDKTEEKGDDLKEKTEDKAEEAKDKTEDKAEDAKDKSEEKGANLEDKVDEAKTEAAEKADKMNEKKLLAQDDDDEDEKDDDDAIEETTTEEEETTTEQNELIALPQLSPEDQTVGTIPAPQLPEHRNLRSVKLRRLGPAPGDDMIHFDAPVGLYTRYPAAAFNFWSLSSPYYRAVTAQPQAIPLNSPATRQSAMDVRHANDQNPTREPPFFPAFYGYRAPRTTWNVWNYPTNGFLVGYH